MQSAINNLRASTGRVRTLGGLHSALETLTTTAIDSSDLLRAQIVLTVSALDYFVHEITVIGILDIFNNTRPPTDAFKRQKVSGYLLIGASAGSAAHFEEDLRQRHSLLSFQQPDKISDAIRLFSNKSLWIEVGIRLSKNADDIKRQIRLIVERRNKIAHQADIDPSYPGARWPISATDTTSAMDFVEEICEAIYDVVK